MDHFLGFRWKFKYKFPNISSTANPQSACGSSTYVNLFNNRSDQTRRQSSVLREINCHFHNTLHLMFSCQKKKKSLTVSTASFSCQRPLSVLDKVMYLQEEFGRSYNVWPFRLFLLTTNNTEPLYNSCLILLSNTKDPATFIKLAISELMSLAATATSLVSLYFHV